MIALHKANMNNKAIKAIEKRLVRLEGAVFGKKAKPTRKADGENFSGATGGVRLLISRNFFNAKRTLGDARGALAESGYHYSAQATEIALKRLAVRKGPLTLLKEGGRNVYVKRK